VQLGVWLLLELVVREEVFERHKCLFLQSFGLENQARELVNQRVGTLHAPDVRLLHLEGNHAVKVHFFALARRERVSAAE